MKFSQLIGRSFPFECGSGIIRSEWNQESLRLRMEETLKHYLFDWEFFYNYTDSKEQRLEYLRTFREQFLEVVFQDIEKVMEQYFTYEKTYRDWEHFLRFKGKFEQTYIDAWFKNAQLSDGLKNEYKAYRMKEFKINPYN